MADPLTALGAAAGGSMGKLFAAATVRVEKTLTGAAKDIAVKAIASLKSYEPYLVETYERVSTFKTFADPSNFVPVMDHFVSPTLCQERSGKGKVSDKEIIKKIVSGNNLIISASAGFGKSMLMRYISLSLFEKPTGVIPLFLELRHINRHADSDILSLINKSYRRNSSIQVEQLRQGLQSGAFCLLLDGFDEVHFEKRQLVEKQISDLASEFPLCSIVVSGRPNEKFGSWRHFAIWHINPMTKYKVIELLKKLNYKKDVVNRFVKKINDGVFETHESFLSTPLLAILMLLTYEQNANIPDKMHLFYAEAFKTLFHKHDATKDQYERNRKSSLQIDEFQEIFSVFCLKTYVLGKVEFDLIELRKHLKDALGYFKKAESVDNLLFDLEEAVCLIMKEGSSYFFVHRSFQEFFTAVFLSSCPMEIRDEFLDTIAIRKWDGVLSMLFDMARDQLEATWIKDNCDKYLQEVSISGEAGKMSPAEARWGEMECLRAEGEKDTEFFDLSSGPQINFISIMHSFYRDSMFSPGKLNFDGLVKYFDENWDKIVSKRDYKPSEDRHWHFASMKIVETPIKLLEESGMAEMSFYEYGRILQIRNSIDSEVRQRSEFIEKLFSMGDRD